MEQSIVQGQSDSADIAKFIENAIRRRSEQWHVLQLICLWSLRENGIPAKHYANLQAMFLRTYGYEQLPVFLHLKLNGMLVERAVHSSVGPLIAPIQTVIGKFSVFLSANFFGICSLQFQALIRMQRQMIWAGNDPLFLLAALLLARTHFLQ